MTYEDDGTRLTWIQPEDWRMSRFVALMGAQLRATYAVRARHRGSAWWSNYDDSISMSPARQEEPMTPV